MNDRPNEPAATVTSGFTSTATTWWVDGDAVTSYDPRSETGLLATLWHHECDRAAHLETDRDRWRAHFIALRALLDQEPPDIEQARNLGRRIADNG